VKRECLNWGGGKREVSWLQGGQKRTKWGEKRGTKSKERNKVNKEEKVKNIR
jgi:hypothetical protein